MKRLHFHIEEELDDALAAEALRRKTSKAALIRRFVSEGLEGRHDSLADLIGAFDGEPADIDEVVYGRP